MGFEKNFYFLAKILCFFCVFLTEYGILKEIFSKLVQISEIFLQNKTPI